MAWVLALLDSFAAQALNFQRTCCVFWTGRDYKWVFVNLRIPVLWCYFAWILLSLQSRNHAMDWGCPDARNSSQVVSSLLNAEFDSLLEPQKTSEIRFFANYGRISHPNRNWCKYLGPSHRNCNAHFSLVIYHASDLCQTPSSSSWVQISPRLLA